MFIIENKSSFKTFVICWETSLICFYWWDRSREKELLFLSQIYLEQVENQLSQVKNFRSKAVRNLAQQQRKTEFWRITEKSVKTTPQHFFAVRFESSFLFNSGLLNIGSKFCFFINQCLSSVQSRITGGIKKAVSELASLSFNPEPEANVFVSRTSESSLVRLNENSSFFVKELLRNECRP